MSTSNFAYQYLRNTNIIRFWTCTEAFFRSQNKWLVITDTKALFRSSHFFAWLVVTSAFSNVIIKQSIYICRGGVSQEAPPRNYQKFATSACILSLILQFCHWCFNIYQRAQQRKYSFFLVCFRSQIAFKMRR